MKRNIFYLSFLLLILTLSAGCSQCDLPLGKSMGRWTDFGLESMIRNHQEGLEYIEVTMNNVIGKEMLIEYSDTTQYQTVTDGWHTAMASGPMLVDGGGSSTLWSSITGVINHPYDNKKWDNEGERAVPNLIVAY